MFNVSVSLPGINTPVDVDVPDDRYGCKAVACRVAEVAAIVSFFIAIVLSVGDFNVRGAEKYYSPSIEARRVLAAV